MFACVGGGVEQGVVAHSRSRVPTRHLDPADPIRVAAVDHHPAVLAGIEADVPPGQLRDALVRAAAGEMVLSQEYATAVLRELTYRRTLEAVPAPTPRET